MSEPLARGERLWRYPTATDADVAVVRQALDAGLSPQGEQAGQAPVWLMADRVVKLQAAPQDWLRSWRRSRLRRAVAGHYQLTGVLTPAPLVLIERRCGGRLRAAGLMMTRLPGVDLDAAWSDPQARAALADVLVTLVARGAIHGDVHAGNILWDGERWGVIDLDSLRHPLHGWVRRRNWRRMWSELVAKLPDRTEWEAVHAAACELAKHRDVSRRWDAIVARANQRRLARGKDPIQ